MLGSRVRGLKAVIQPLFTEHLLRARLLIRCRHCFPWSLQTGASMSRALRIGVLIYVEAVVT